MASAKLAKRTVKPSRPQGDLNAEKKAAGSGDRIFDDVDCGQSGSDLHDKHHGVLRNLSCGFSLHELTLWLRARTIFVDQTTDGTGRLSI